MTVTLTGPNLTGVEVEDRWLRSDADGRDIADEVESACRQGYRAIDDEAAAAPTPHLDAIRDLARDPQEFLRRLTGG
ncbi:hypothetical protein [Actinoplanes flavus]|uniref:Uncharacterized protein n=1 Tax=Actinoplanes flavus TaxID=2820290 RepID=A0ABS3UDX1_9ACTN|nr:hypothetical protein [Actinoplanes flavus]MBO3736943.1 hypothetical protein [Actinoplanes flavus]